MLCSLDNVVRKSSEYYIDFNEMVVVLVREVQKLA